MMKVLITGSSGHLGEALVRTLRDASCDVVGLDIKPSPFTTIVGSISDSKLVSRCMRGVDAVYHAATLHKPHLVTHQMREFVETNIQGTLTILESAVANQVQSFVFTSSTSVFGDALRPPLGEPATWVTEDLTPIPRNIYGVTKLAAEELCHLFHRKHGLNCIVLRTSRFFPEADDDRTVRESYEDGNVKANEFLFRRVDLEDVVNAHLLASERAQPIGFGNYIISATTPFFEEDLVELRSNAPRVLHTRVPDYESNYQDRGWRMFPGIDRVYVNRRARQELNWQPKYDFARVLGLLGDGADPRSVLAREVGSKGYHSVKCQEEPYPVDE